MTIPTALDTVAGLRRARIGIITLFVTVGIVSGSLASRVPAIQGHLHLSAGELGIALLGTAVGSVVSTPITGAVLARVAPRRWIVVGLIPSAVFLPATARATGPLSLLLTLLGVGFGLGCVDVAMNTEATRIEARYGRRIMSGIHATFSLGTLIGAALGAVLAGASVSFGSQFLGVSAVTLVGGTMAVILLPDAPVGRPGSTAGAPRRAFPQLRWPLVALAVVCFSCMLSEGAADDWTAVYLHTSLGAPAEVGALAYAGFCATMVLGRLAGDRLIIRFGPVRMMRSAAVLGAVGLGAALLIGDPIVGIAGFALLGFGLSIDVPLATTAASAFTPAGSSVALVTSCGYLGFLSGPPLIGGLATAFSLPVALALVVGLCVALAALAGNLRSPA